MRKRKSAWGAPHAPTETRWDKRGIALFLSAAMCLSMLPTMALADNSDAATTDEYGFDTQTDVVVYRCWASIEPARGKVFYEMDRKADTEYSKITIRWRPGVTHDMKVKYQNHLYDIDTIVDPYMRHEALELYCMEEVRGTDNERK